MNQPTTSGYGALTEKEKQTLRLIVRGHDAKSTARHLNLSVHTINERLRDARRKLAVSSSREAARLLLDREAADPDFVGDSKIGAATRAATLHFDGRNRRRNAVRIGLGGAAVLLTLGLLALTALPLETSDTGQPVAATAAVETDVTAAAQRWLALVDRSQWQESWQATGGSFRQLNTAEVWASLSQKVRVPLGAVQSRVLVSQESVPAGPAGVEMVKFRTSFAAKPDTIETLSLAREDGRWRVVGYYIG